jgi:tetratricopeptide (TPR) repeat protein
MACHVHRRAVRYSSMLFGLLAALMQRLPAASPTLTPEIHSLALAEVDCIYKNQYHEAEDSARKIIEKIPTEPAGYFFMAVAIDSWMAAHLSDKREEEFFRYCDLAVEKGKKVLKKDPTNEWAQFFIGGAEGYKGNYEARYRRWITAFKYGWKGVSILMQLRDKKSELVDITVGIGQYEYWRSALMKSLWWMPHVDDKRLEGIELVQQARVSGIYTRVNASASLIDILINEDSCARALTIANESLEHYPLSQVFILGKARALFGVHKFEEAEIEFRRILTNVEVDPNEGHAMIALCHFWLAKIDFALERFAECITECDLMTTYEFEDDSKKLLTKNFDEAETLKKKAIVARKNKLQSAQAKQKP